MGPLSKRCLLFALNLIDAQLTLVWIRLNVATEGNALMARLLEHGDLQFFGAKVLIGGFAAYTLYRCAHLPLAKHGLTVVLGVYMVLMVIHGAAGCSAFGWQTPAQVLAFVESLPHAFFSLFI